MFWQGAIAEQMQEYNDAFAVDNIRTTLVDTDSISTVPISAFIGRQDTLCLPETAEAHFSRMTTMTKLHYFDQDHSWFGQMNGQEYYDLIECELAIPDGTPSTCFGCFLQDTKLIMAGAAVALGLFTM